MPLAYVSTEIEPRKLFYADENEFLRENEQNLVSDQNFFFVGNLGYSNVTLSGLYLYLPRTSGILPPLNTAEDIDDAINHPEPPVTSKPCNSFQKR